MYRWKYELLKVATDSPERQQLEKRSSKGFSWGILTWCLKTRRWMRTFWEKRRGQTDGERSLSGEYTSSWFPGVCKYFGKTKQVCSPNHYHPFLSRDVCMLSRFSHAQPCDPFDCSLPDSSAHGIPQARILEWVDISLVGRITVIFLLQMLCFINKGEERCPTYTCLWHLI